jgi:tripartite-type tricarboxylate transporter receptor subunit TctC
MKGIFRIFAILAMVVVCGTVAFAQQGFPSKPVRLLIPYAAGGAVDILGRTLGDELSKRWGQPVIIENRTGAGGTIASQALVKSDPDGYTLIIVASGHSMNPYLYQRLPYDTFKLLFYSKM